MRGEKKKRLNDATHLYSIDVLQNRVQRKNLAHFFWLGRILSLPPVFVLRPKSIYALESTIFLALAIHFTVVVVAAKG